MAEQCDGACAISVPATEDVPGFHPGSRGFGWFHECTGRQVPRMLGEGDRGCTACDPCSIPGPCLVAGEQWAPQGFSWAHGLLL